jgi:hypothetical protein
MKMLVAGAVLATLVASPAFAQSYDPDLGTGNIAPWNYSTTSARGVPQGGHAGFARAVPGGARSPEAAYGAVTPFGSPVRTQSGENHSSAAREAALRECSLMSRRYTQTTWGNMEIHQHRTCMAQHGQME